MAERPGWGLLLKPALLVAGLAAAGWALRSLPIQDFAHRAGTMGDAYFVLLGAAACAVGAPRQLIAFAAGYAHGLWPGAALALLAQILGCAADLLWARLIARDWVKARLAGRFGPRLARLDAFLAAHPFGATLTLRLLPVGNNLALNLLAGGFGLPIAAFLAASALGYLPQTIVFVLLGSGISIARTTRLILAIALLAASIGGGLWLLRRTPRAL